MNPNEYDWQMGGLADLGLYPDERGFQPTPTPPEKAWPVPTTGMAPWPYQEQPAQTEAELAQQAREAAAYRNRRGYEVASTRPQESNRLTAVAGAIGNLPYAMGSLAAIPGQTMAANPHLPGSEEWQFFEDARKSNTYEKAPELAFNLMGTGTAFSAPGSFGIFGGRGAKTADLGMLKKAEDMAKGGATADDIYGATKWFQGADGKWRFEIPDYQSKWIKGQEPSKLPRGRGPTVTRTELAYQHPELYEAYPELRDMPLVVQKMGKDTRGAYQPPPDVDEKARVFLSPGSAKSMRSAFLHETQHAVQDIENLAVGGNPMRPVREGTPAWEIYQRMKAQATEPMTFDEFVGMARDMGGYGVTKDDYQKYLKSFENFRLSPSADDKIRRLAAYENYRLSAGETEARNVQARADFKPDRLTIHPYATQDVPLSKQTVDFREPRGGVMGSLAQLSQEPLTGFAPKAPSIVAARNMPTAEDIAAIKAAAVQYGRKGWPTTERGVFKTTPEAYAETTQLVPQVSIKQHLPGQPWETAPGDMPNKGRANVIVQNTDRISENIANRLAPLVEQESPLLKFYHTGPVIRGLEQHAGLTVPQGNAFMREWAGQGAATSPRTQTPPNLRNSSYLLYERSRGNPLTPERYASEGNIPGFPMMGMHVDLAEKFATRGEMPWANPKPTTFRENWSGNLRDVTGDTHNIRSTLYEMDQVQPGSLPRGWFTSDKAYAQYRKEGFRSLDPGDIVDTLGTKATHGVSRQTEYLPMTEPWYRAAEKLGIAPAEAQSGGWFSYGDITGLQSPPKTIVNLLNDQIAATSRALGIAPEKVVEWWAQGKIPLAGFAGAGALAPSVMGELARQDKYAQ